MKYIPFMRRFEHIFSFKKVIDRTPDDNKEAEEFTADKFKNRKGGDFKNFPSLYDDVFIYHKYPTKPKDGTRKFKGSETIRKMEASEDDS